MTPPKKRFYWLLALLEGFGAVGYAQGLPEAPEAPEARLESFRGILKERQTQIELSAVAVSLSLDGLTTIGGSHWHEINPVCRPFTRSNAGVAGYMALGFAGVIVSNRVLIHHPRLRHGLNWVVVGMEIGAVSFNRSH